MIFHNQWLWYMDQFYILFWIRLESFFPSNALWLPPGRSTCFQACCKLDYLIDSCRGRSCNGRKSKLVEDRYIVQIPCHISRAKTETQEQKANNKKQKTHQKQTQTKNKTTTHTKQKQPHKHTTVTWRVPVYGWNSSVEASCDSLVSSRHMQMTAYVSCSPAHK